MDNQDDDMKFPSTFVWQLLQYIIFPLLFLFFFFTFYLTSKNMHSKGEDEIVVRPVF